MADKNLHQVDWTTLPAPEDDGGARHLLSNTVPSLSLQATNGSDVNLAQLVGKTALFAYPMTGRPDQDLPDGWDMIPGARGCTPQACAFRDLVDDLQQSGFQYVFGISTQDTTYQQEAAARLHLPFPLLSDVDGLLRNALDLPTMTVEGATLLKRLTLIIENGQIVKVFYPVFPPDQSAQEVLNWANNERPVS